MVKPGPNGEIVNHYEFAEEERVPEDTAHNTTIRWLLSNKRDGVPTFAMRMFRVKPGGYIKAHKHPWEHEIFVLEGVGEIRIGDVVYRVSRGFYIYIPPNVEHEYRNRGDKDLVFLCMIPVTGEK
ncbi:MAG: cupin domain-containing protein [Thermoprotei archaeon]